MKDNEIKDIDYDKLNVVEYQEHYSEKGFLDKIKSIAKNQYFNGQQRNDTNVTFNATGTEYTIAISGGNVTMSNGGYYIRHRSTASQVQMGNSDNGRNWIFYPVTID